MIINPYQTPEHLEPIRKRQRWRQWLEVVAGFVFGMMVLTFVPGSVALMFLVIAIGAARDCFDPMCRPPFDWGFFFLFVGGPLVAAVVVGGFQILVSIGVWHYLLTDFAANVRFIPYIINHAAGE